MDLVPTLSGLTISEIMFCFCALITQAKKNYGRDHHSLLAGIILESGNILMPMALRPLPFFSRILTPLSESISNNNTVEPVYNGHPRNLRNWPLNTGGCLIQDHYKYSLGVVERQFSWCITQKHFMQGNNRTINTLSSDQT